VQDSKQNDTHRVSLYTPNVSYQWDDKLAVAAGGEGVLHGKLLPDLLVVVLSIGLFIQSFNSNAVRKLQSCTRLSTKLKQARRHAYHNNNSTVLAVEGLVAGELEDDGEPLLLEEVALTLVQPGPIGSTV
jgi:hypothetical protein